MPPQRSRACGCSRQRSAPPFRARLLDRIGRHRIIVPQTLLVGALLPLFAVAVTIKSFPLAVVLLAAIGHAAVSPSTDSVIHTLWRTIGEGEQQIKALHPYDSILERYQQKPVG